MSAKPCFYLIGSLRNEAVSHLGLELRKATECEIYNEWFSAGFEADDEWQRHEKIMGRSFKEALDGWHVKTVFESDKFHLDRCNGAILVLPAGKSCHLEFGYVIGQGKPGFIYMQGEPERFDAMYRFATKVCTDFDELVAAVKRAAKRRRK